MPAFHFLQGKDGWGDYESKEDFVIALRPGLFILFVI
jgi:hypothetical protein